MRLRIIGLVALVAALSGCAAHDAAPASAPPPSIVPSRPAASFSAVPSLVEQSIRGTVKEGVEPGCMLLTTDSKTYLLIGGDRAALNSGKQVTVYGSPQPDLMTTCQQGTPFKVTKIEP